MPDRCHRAKHRHQSNFQHTSSRTRKVGGCYKRRNSTNAQRTRASTHRHNKQLEALELPFHKLTNHELSSILQPQKDEFISGKTEDKELTTNTTPSKVIGSTKESASDLDKNRRMLQKFISKTETSKSTKVHQAKQLCESKEDLMKTKKSIEITAENIVLNQEKFGTSELDLIPVSTVKHCLQQSDFDIHSNRSIADNARSSNWKNTGTDNFDANLFQTASAVVADSFEQAGIPANQTSSTSKLLSSNAPVVEPIVTQNDSIMVDNALDTSNLVEECKPYWMTNLEHALRKSNDNGERCSPVRTPISHKAEAVAGNMSFDAEDHVSKPCCKEKDMTTSSGSAKNQNAPLCALTGCSGINKIHNNKATNQTELLLSRDSHKETDTLHVDVHDTQKLNKMGEVKTEFLKDANTPTSVAIEIESAANQHVISAIAKNVQRSEKLCPACNKIVYLTEQVRTSCGCYHIRCLRCAHCQNALSRSKYNTRNDLILCNVCNMKELHRKV